MTKKTSSRQHMLLFKYPPGSTPPSPPEMKQIMARFAGWMDGLHKKQRVAAANGLGLSGQILRGPIGETVITDGPYAEGKEVIGGYVLLDVPMLKEAVKIAGACPGLDYGMIVEVRPVERP